MLVGALVRLAIEATDFLIVFIFPAITLFVNSEYFALPTGMFNQHSYRNKHFVVSLLFFVKRIIL